MPIPIINDTLAEGTQSVNLALSNVSGGSPAAVLGVRSAAVLNINDDDQAGTLRFSLSNFTVAEPATLTGTTTATITVTADGGYGSGVTVDYVVTDGTAAAGANYAPATGRLTFAAGQTSQTFPVTVSNDGRAQGNLTATLTLFDPTGAPPWGPAAPPR